MLTNQQIIQQLKKFRAIRPDERFSADLKALILAQPKRKEPFNIFLTRLNFSKILAGKAVRRRFLMSSLAVGVLAAVLFLIIIFPQLFNKPILSSFNNDKKLNEEFNGLSINIQLREINYRQITDQTIATAIGEITDTNTKHLNLMILETEIDEMDFNNNINPQVEEFLNQVIF